MTNEEENEVNKNCEMGAIGSVEKMLQLTASDYELVNIEISDADKKRFGHEPKEVNKYMGGFVFYFEFSNGYGASVIRHARSYGGTEGFWELVVLHNDKLCYDTPITDDVIGWLEEKKVSELIKEISELPKKA